MPNSYIEKIREMWTETGANKRDDDDDANSTSTNRAKVGDGNVNVASIGKILLLGVWWKKLI